MTKFNRRRVLRGVLNGSAVTVALPLLNCFLNGNGTAMADGKPMPVRFGTWFWNLGMSRSVFVPKQTGNHYELPEEIACLKPVQDKINLLTDYIAYRDGAPVFCHGTGTLTTRSGQCPVTNSERPGESFDVTIANKIGKTTRFKMLTATANGDIQSSQSYNGQNSVNAPEVSPVKFYTRLFGADFQNPNAASFTPDPRVMVRKSVLSEYIMDGIKDLQREVGAEDRARLDQHFTGLRAIERQLDQRLTKPDPIEACVPKAGPKGDPVTGIEVDVMASRHKLMTDLLVMALACDQTRVFNMMGSANLATKKGLAQAHHTLTHEEPFDDKLGYQPNVSWFMRRAMENWLYFVQAFDGLKEGGGTLLDNSLIFAHSEVSLARIHSVDNMAMFTAGRAGGRVKSGFHVSGKGQASVANGGFTMMQAMGLDLASWGTKSNNTSKVISEIMV